MAGTKRPADDAGSSAAKKFKSGDAKASGKPTSSPGAKPAWKHADGKKSDWNKGEKKWNRQGSNGVKETVPQSMFDLKCLQCILLTSPDLNSREAHAAQRTLAHQRKLSKPNGDTILRSKKIWERLRIKSAVPVEERKELVAELFEIITGRVKDFVFKHDSVRVIQCALKYATPAQKRIIVQELRGAYRELAESKYGKFLVGKLVMVDNEARDVIVGEFAGGVKRMIKGPESGWILDDVYRGAATKKQKAVLLREWYGTEFAVFGNATGDEEEADLAKILEKNPEKRGPIMGHLKEMINLLVQKKTTAFAMLHDAMLQYFLSVKVGSPEQTEFLEMLKDDEEGDCMRNLAFTKSGSRLVCLALAYGSAKDRRTIMKFFKTHIKLMAGDASACRVLLTAYEVIDDTVMTAKTIFPELLGKDMAVEERDLDLLSMASHVTPRMSLLYSMAPDVPKWLVTEEETTLIEEVRSIREGTSKKQPEKRRTELAEAISQPLLDFVASQASTLASSSFGCQFMAEVLLGGIGDKDEAFKALLDVVGGDSAVVETPHFGRTLKTLVQGGRFDPATKTVLVVDPPVKFHDLLYELIVSKDQNAILEWASGANSWTVLSMLEAANFSYATQMEEYLLQHSESLEGDNIGSQKILQKIRGVDVKPARKELEERPKKKAKSKK